jgi:hypothetical protein
MSESREMIYAFARDNRVQLYEWRVTVDKKEHVVWAPTIADALGQLDLRAVETLTIVQLVREI